MKKLLVTASVALTAMQFLTGCYVRSIGSSPTLGEQLKDLKTAQVTGAITNAEYQAQKARLLKAKTFGEVLGEVDAKKNLVH
ncbi:MAG: SHOCT domain-containing protein [Akkermansiaceae bacterium]|nr:SHOCT domain-containing protein [Akkermansiaceae bacterium]